MSITFPPKNNYVTISQKCISFHVILCRVVGDSGSSVHQKYQPSPADLRITGAVDCGYYTHFAYHFLPSVNISRVLLQKSSWIWQ